MELSKVIRTGAGSPSHEISDFVRTAPGACFSFSSQPVRIQEDPQDTDLLVP